MTPVIAPPLCDCYLYEVHTVFMVLCGIFFGDSRKYEMLSKDKYINCVMCLVTYKLPTINGFATKVVYCYLVFSIVCLENILK